MGNNLMHSIITDFLRFTIPKKTASLVITYENRKSVFKKNRETYDYIALVNIVEEEKDIQLLFEEAGKHLLPNGRLIVIYNNYLQSYFTELLNSIIGKKTPSRNWLSSADIQTFLRLADFDPIVSQPLCLISINIPFISNLVNRLIVNLFPFNHLSFLHATIARKKNTTIADKTVTMVVPARNEEGNIEPLFTSLPLVGSDTEVIFVEGHSKDNTLEEIKRCIAKYKNSLPFSFKLIRQKGIGKGQAVREGFNKAKGDILIIYDADLSVSPADVNKFYLALITHKGDFINGSRLVYPMERNAMQFINILGNKFFSLAYSWILGQRIKDTLCGTKVLYRSDYQKIAKEDFFGKYDPFGDFELLLGAGKLNLKIIDLPIRYHERKYGSTNIKRFKNALELARFSIVAIRKLKMRLK